MSNDYDVFIRWRWDLKIDWSQHWIKETTYFSGDRNEVVKLMFNQWIDYLETKDDLPVVLTDGNGGTWMGWTL